jgi:hypothetical protein
LTVIDHALTLSRDSGRHESSAAVTSRVSNASHGVKGLSVVDAGDNHYHPRMPSTISQAGQAESSHWLGVHAPGDLEVRVGAGTYPLYVRDAELVGRSIGEYYFQLTLRSEYIPVLWKNRQFAYERHVWVYLRNTKLLHRLMRVCRGWHDARESIS